jgi:hypothetical protein
MTGASLKKDKWLSRGYLGADTILSGTEEKPVCFETVNYNGEGGIIPPV